MKSDGQGKAGFTPEQAKAAYHTMLLVRRFEEKVAQMYGLGLIGGYCHLYIGQEAIIAGVAAHYHDGDQMITGYRDHAHALACGVDPRRVLAELAGRRNGLSKGKGGSMHLFAPQLGFFGGHGIVGAQVSLGTGLAFAMQHQKKNGVVICFFGDGAANQGQVYECFNMAQLWRLPILYIIENNRYAMGTPVMRASAVTDFSRRGTAFDVPGARVDGMDVAAVHAATGAALAAIRAGGGPRILEMQTYRYRGHSMADPAKYRSAEEVQKMRETQDPIDQLRDWLLQGGHISESELRAIETGVRARISEAAEYAAHQPEPDAAELMTDVLA
ncbi:MAG: pyruvate dehydrogenase (acetyl-transferring) E1 component subunit alpha [Hyphomicrobiales bacterium]|nr:pyruvate dehydrogenase (acetyl-transferring) E1 component subunit alpha [Hyphomicrobiales bacterium]